MDQLWKREKSVGETGFQANWVSGELGFRRTGFQSDVWCSTGKFDEYLGSVGAEFYPEMALITDVSLKFPAEALRVRFCSFYLLVARFCHN